MKEQAHIQSEIENLLDSKESDYLEFKKAKGGLPKALWETYSAFANTHGGLIVLGVEEVPDNRLKLAGLQREEVERLRESLFRGANNRQVVSVCLLSDKDVTIEQVEDSYLLFIQVPPASLDQRPVYLGSDPERGTYRRGDEGDFLCSPLEVRRMYADSGIGQPADSRILRGYSWDDIDLPSLDQYRRLFSVKNPSHVWLTEDNLGLMKKLGGYRKDRKSREEGFTLAGLLMFGKVEAIQDNECTPHYFPDYQVIPQGDDSQRWIDRIYPDGTWEANLFQFYLRVLPKL